VQNVIEAEVTGAPKLGYDEVLHPDWYEPHAGLDESGKGDFFGPLVACAVYVDPDLAHAMQEMGVKEAIASELAAGSKALEGLHWGPKLLAKVCTHGARAVRTLCWPCTPARCTASALPSVPRRALHACRRGRQPKDLRAVQRSDLQAVPRCLEALGRLGVQAPATTRALLARYSAVSSSAGITPPPWPWRGCFTRTPVHA
jgi:hypothetical protein